MKIVRMLRGAGSGPKPKRLFPSRTNFDYPDPFLLLDHFSMTRPDGFPDHPHRGFEIITYVLEGVVEHADSAGNEGAIRAGGMQHINSGRGIIHSEMPGPEGTSSGLQLWINLPRSQKKMEPSYRDLKPEEVPAAEKNGVRIRHLVGGPSKVKLQRPMIYRDVFLDRETSYEISFPENHQGFIYILQGEGILENEDTTIGEGDFIKAASSADPALIVRTTAGMRFVYAAGEPIGEEPIYNGPYVD